MIARPTPRLVPDRPTLSAIEPPGATCPSWVDTSPRAATTPNCPNPAANAVTAMATTARSVQRCSRNRATASGADSSGMSDDIVVRSSGGETS